MAATSRSLTIGIFRFVLVGLLASNLLLGTTWIFAFATAWCFEGDWTSPTLLSVGAECSLIVWLFVAVFHLRGETQNVPFSQRDPFVAKVKVVLQEMGYQLTFQRADTLLFRPRFHSYLFGGSILEFRHRREALG